MIRLVSTYISSVFILLTVFTACTKEYPSIEDLDTQKVEEYIQKNNLQVQEYNQSGIYYEVLEEGNGPDLDYSKKIPLLYTIKSLDGTFTTVDTFTNRYAGFLGYFKPDSLREVMMQSSLKQGGTIRVIIPSRFAFGKAGSGAIPGNSSLDYTLTAITADKLGDYEDYIINQYMIANNLSGFSKTASGLYYKIADIGTGTTDITDESILTLEYTGKLLNGTVFDKTGTGATATLTLSNLIKGWREALPLVKKGGSIRILVPSSLGYDLEGGGSIPPFSSLDFDIKVIDVL